MSGNEAWARRLAGRWLPAEKFRWELYSEWLAVALDRAKPWLDLGCGHSDFIAEFAERVSPAVGVDLQYNTPPPGIFTAARLESLPFAGGSAGTLSLRFVLEHIEYPESLWRECRRVLAPGGRLVIITTNRRSPIVAAGRLLARGIKSRLIAFVFGVEEVEIFPTFHRWNSPGRLGSPPPGFELERMEYVEALDWSRRPVFVVQLLLARITRVGFMRKFRSNVLAVYRRTGEQE